MLTPTICSTTSILPQGSHVILNIRRLGAPGALSRTDVSYLWDYDLDVNRDTFCGVHDEGKGDDVEVIHIEMSDLARGHEY